MYKLTDADVIIRTTDGACIPMVGGNRDYQDYLEWVAAGNTPAPFVPPPVPVPVVVTMRQARLALLQTNRLATVNAALDAMAGTPGEAARIEWEYAATVERASSLVASLALALSLTEQDLDDLFTLAATL